MDLCLPSLANWYSSQHPVLLCMFAGYLRLPLHCKQPEVLEHGAILLQDSATPHHHHDVEYLAHCWSWEVVAQPSHSLDLVPSGYLFACVKEHLWGKQFESRDGINTAVAASSHRLSTDEYRAAIDCLSHRWEKCVDSADDYIEWRTCV